MFTKKIRGIFPCSKKPKKQHTLPALSNLLTRDIHSPSNFNQRKITKTILTACWSSKASAVHVENMNNCCKVFFRIEGILHEVASLSEPDGRIITDALKKAAENYILGRYNVQEGRITLQIQNQERIYAIYIIPNKERESITIKPEQNSFTTTYPVGPSAITSEKSEKNIRKKIFIWQMGKVGSLSVYNSLIPYSTPTEWHIPTIKNNAHWPVHNNIIQTHSIELLYDFLHYSGEEFIIISLVRDLIARNISSIFQSMNFEEEWRNDYFIASIEDFKKWSFEQQEEAITCQLSRLNLNESTLCWYDNLLKSHVYYPNIEKYFIDIYSKPFNQDKGYQIYESNSPRIKMIIIRMEDLNNLEKELGNFLQIDNFRLAPGNFSTNKWYQHIYNKFKQRYSPAQEELEKIYNSKFMQYFYSKEQINELMKQWNNPQ